MLHLFRLLILASFLLATSANASATIYKILEQDEDGVASHRVFDETSIGDGIDPVLQFIILDAPVDPTTAQLLWQASDRPIGWSRTADEPSYRMVEYADIPFDGQIEYRVYGGRTGREFVSKRHVRTPNDQDFSVDPDVIDSLADGDYDLHVHLDIPGRPTHILKQRLVVADVVAEAIEEEQFVENVVEDNRPTLEPGNGWTGDLETPGPTGDPSHPGYGYAAIARWAVVQQQAFDRDFAIGVVAFHSYGIDRVDFSVDGGPWVSVQEKTNNPRTNVDEFVVDLDPTRFEDGGIVVRAIAYPEHGQPRVLRDLVLFANAGGTLDFPVFELDAGTYDALDVPQPPSEGWLTVRPKPGVAADQVIIRQINRVWGGNLKFQDVTMRPKAGLAFCYGRQTGEGKVWFDRCDIEGNGRERMTGWLAHLWGTQVFTDSKISRVQNVFHGGGGELFARNVQISDVYEDIFRGLGFATNVTIEGVRGEDWAHPDLFDFASGWTQRNVIFYNIKVRGAYAQGMAGANIADTAMVNVDVETPGWASMQIGGTLRNVLFKNTRLKGGALFRDAKPDGVVIRNSLLGYKSPYVPQGSNHPGVTFIDHPFDLGD